MIKAKQSLMGASVQRQTHSESNLQNVAANSRGKPCCPVDELRKKAAVSQRHLERAVTCSSDKSSSIVDVLKQRLRMLEIENCRLMSNQGQLVAETNRRVEMHINEVRALKEELKEVQISNKELRDLCCFLDDDRQKTRRLSREWQKFGRYTSEVMKQEVKAYQAKLRELEDRQQMLINENDELKRLCLYLDEQRQNSLLSKTVNGNQVNVAEQNSSIKAVDNSIGCDSSGCGSSAGSQRGSEDEADESPNSLGRRIAGYDDKQENTLRMITQQMQTSLTLERCSTGAEKSLCSRYNSSHEDHLLEYIQSLETRIRQLELSTQYNMETRWPSNTNLDLHGGKRNGVETPELGLCGAVEKSDNKNAISVSVKTCISSSEIQAVPKKEMVDSTTSIMTSSGTTYCSSDTDDSVETAVIVTGNEIDNNIARLKVRTLCPIDEEKEESSKTEEVTCFEVTDNDVVPGTSKSISGNQMPPAIAPVSASVSRLSSCCSDLSLDGVPFQKMHGYTTPTSKSTERSSSLVDLSKTTDFGPPTNSGSNIVRDSLAEAVKVLRVHEMAARKNMRGLTAQETAIVQHMCQIAWDSLDRKSQLLGNGRAESVNSLKAPMTAV